jgi:hypothetical protein
MFNCRIQNFLSASMPDQFYSTAVNFVYAYYTCHYFERQRLSAQFKSLLSYLLHSAKLIDDWLENPHNLLNSKQLSWVGSSLVVWKRHYRYTVDVNGRLIANEAFISFISNGIIDDLLKPHLFAEKLIVGHTPTEIKFSLFWRND